MRKGAILSTNSVLLKANTDVFVRQVIPDHFKLTCFLSIEKNALGLHSKYRLYLAEDRQFLLSAKKEIFKYYSNFLISRHPGEVHRRSDNYVGRIEANFLGTEFFLFAAKHDAETLSLQVHYRKNLAGFNGPRFFRVTKAHPKNKKAQDLASLMERKEHSRMVQLETLEPSLKKGKYRLDFEGKAKIASSRNFILGGE